MARQMKESGIAWIGEIPEGWVCCKQKHVIELINGRAYRDDEFLPEAKYRVLRVGNLFTNSKWYYSDMELESNKYCECGDLIYAWSASYGPYIWDGEKVIYHYHIWKTVLSASLDKKFAYYYLLALGESIAIESHGSAMQHITMERMNDSYIAYPGLSEQRSIADFLDLRCAEIDAVIESTKATIEEYKKLKQAIITEAVTKGVRGPRKMKDSGIEWIGEIPEGWEVTRVKHIASRVTDGAHVSPELENGVYDFVSTVNINNGKIDFENCLKTSAESYHQFVNTGCQPRKNDVLISKDGTVGKTAIVAFEHDFVVASSLVIISPLCNVILPTYLNYNLQAKHTQEALLLLMHGAGLKRVSIEKNANLTIILAPYDEQAEIVAYLDEKCAALDTLIAKKTALLTELETYKKSLIYEFVTGKKEVV